MNEELSNYCIITRFTHANVKKFRDGSNNIIVIRVQPIKSRDKCHNNNNYHKNSNHGTFIHSSMFPVSFV